jgi:DNA-binding transcriptional LysR family regulator
MEGIRQEVKGWLDEARADIGFLSGGSDLASYHWIPIAEDRMLAVLPPDHPLAGHQNYPVRQCIHEDFIMPALGRDDDVAALFERFQIEPHILFSTLENYAAISMIENGLGMSIMNELITKNFQAEVVMLPLDPPQSITLGMAVPIFDNASPAVKRFTEYVERFGNPDQQAVI